MGAPVYGEPCSTPVLCSTPDPAPGPTSGPASGSTSSSTDALMLSAMGKVIDYLKALEATKNKNLAMDSLNTLILTVKNELSKLK
jgi:hypothetical protein